MTVTAAVATVREVHGVSYHRKHGAECPECGQQKARIKNTLPWEEGLRQRYHDCQSCGTRFKSLEEDPEQKPEASVSGFRSNPMHPLAR